jgi:YD repeat-containing protein
MCFFMLRASAWAMGEEQGNRRWSAQPQPRETVKMAFDGAELEIPAGAAESELSVEMAEPNLTGIARTGAFKAVSKIYRFGPSGTKFASGKELTLRIDLDAKIKNAKLYYINRANKRLEKVRSQTLNNTTGKLEAKISHFSDYVLGISAGWDGSGPNPFMDYITEGIESVPVYGHTDPIIRLNAYSVKGRGMDLNFTIATDTWWGIGSIGSGLKLDLPFIRHYLDDIDVNIPGKGLYSANIDNRPTSEGTGSLAGWKIYNYNGSSFAVKVKETVTDYGESASDNTSYNIYEPVVYLSNGTCIRDYETYQTVTDMNGNMIKYTYHLNHYVDSDNDDIYNELIDTITDTMGRIFYFTYNAEGNLTQVRQKLSNQEMKTILTCSYSKNQLIITDAVGRAYTIHYTSIGIYDGIISGINYPNGVRSEYLYSGSYSIYRQKWYKPNQTTAFREVKYDLFSDYIYDGTTKKEYTFTDSGDVLTEKVYSIASGKLLKKVTNKYSVIRHAGTTIYSELLASSATTLTHSDGSSGQSFTYSYEWDNWGNITKVTDPKGTVTVMSYANTNSSKALASSGYQDPLFTTGAAWNQMITKATIVKDTVHGTSQLKQTHYKYDATTGNLLQENEVYNGGYLNTYYTYDDYGNMLTKTDANGNKLCFEYAATDDQPYESAYLTKVSTSGGVTLATFGYDFDTGNKITATDPKENIYRYEYDAIGRKTKEYLDDSDTALSIARILNYDDTNNILVLR